MKGYSAPLFRIQIQSVLIRYVYWALCIVGVVIAVPLSCPTAKPSISPTIAPTKIPTRVPTVSLPGVNATLSHGYLYFGQSNVGYLGMNSSTVNYVLSKYFPWPSYKNLAIVALMNSSSPFLSYLTLVGSYIADVPIMLPSQTVLVLTNATLSVTPSFGNASSGHNTKAIYKSPYNAVIVMASVTSSAVVSPSGPLGAMISCLNTYQYSSSLSSSYVGPAGILAMFSTRILISGVTIDKCGAGGGSIALYYGSHAEVEGCVITDAATRGVWVLGHSRLIMHGSVIATSGKFGLDFDASSSLGVAFGNGFSGNGYDGVFVEQGSYFDIVAYNAIGPNNGVGECHWLTISMHLNACTFL